MCEQGHVHVCPGLVRWDFFYLRQMNFSKLTSQYCLRRTRGAQMFMKMKSPFSYKVKTGLHTPMESSQGSSGSIGNVKE